MRESERQQIFDEWMSAHTGLLMKIVRAYAFTSEDREDLLQEIGLQLWESIPRQRGEAADTTWIYRVSLYTALGWTRRERKHSTGRFSLDTLEELVRDESLPQNDRVSWLYSQIAALPELDRSLVLLMFEGFSYREMSRILGMSESNVGVRISRIKRRFVTAAEGAAV